jgi:gliding motility-associated-like protein
MNTLITKVFRILTIVAFSQQIAFSQTCPSVNAQAGTGASTTICLGQCANLTASVIPVKATTTYSVGSLTYAALPFSGGVTLPSVDDVWSDSLNIGFNFCYFGTTYNKLVVGSNGEINFNKMLANGFNNYNVSTTLPNTIDLPGNSICGIFKDIDLSAGGVARTYTTGVAPCRKFVAYWDNVPLYQGPGDNCGTILNTFQIVLHEGTNYIDVNVETTAPCGLGGNTDRGIIGIQNAAGTTAFAPAGRNVLTAWSATNESWRFTPNGAPTFTVNWSGPAGFTATGLTATPCPTATSNYTATMNVANCDGSITPFTSVVQVSVAPVPSPVATPTAICRGSSSTLTATGAATSYTWNPGGLTTSSIVVSPTVTTTYTLTTLTGLCANTSTISLVVNTLPTLTGVSNPTVICSSGGSSTLTSTGAISYTWNPGALTGNTVVVSPTLTTQYTVTGANAAGCTNTKTVNLIVGSPPVVSANTLSATVCAGSTTTLTASGASTYTWIPGPVIGATVVVTPTANTIYTVTGRNAAGCTDTETISISVTPGITVTASASPTIMCAGNTATLSAGGATSYTWMPGAISGSSITVTPSVTTTYSVTGTASGCTNTKTVTIRVNTPTITVTKAPALTCAGSSATLTATGASTYTWSPGGMSSNSIVITPTATSIYTVVATNTMGCVGTRTTNVVMTPNPTVTIGASSSSICTGGSSTLTAGGGTSYTWSPGATTLTTLVVNPATTTTYSLTGRNSSNCRVTNTISIFVAPIVTVTAVSSPSVICNGSSSTLTASGALNYTWMPGGLTGSTVAVSPSSTTTYSVVGATSLGCTNITTVNVGLSIVNLTATSNPTILCSSNTATLTGTGASTYTWNPGGLTGNTVVVTPATATVYTLTATNALGCTGTKTLNLSVGVTPTITAATSSTLVCSGTTVTLSSSGASTYTWMPGSMTGSVVVATPSVNTIYTVTGRNASGCATTNTVDVSVNPSPIIAVNSNPTVLCPGFSATLTATGAPTYTWNPGAIANGTIVVSPAATTIYSVVGTSALGCTGSATVNLKVNPTPTITAISSTGTICPGTTATLTGSGANSYTWNPGPLTGTNVAVSPTISTTYTVTGDNGLGCISTETVSINVLPTLTVTANASPTIICLGNSSTLTATGGSTYTWSPGGLTGASVTVNPSATTLYTVTAENSLGCTKTETVSLAVSIPTITTVSSPTALCAGSTATLTGSGASTYTWQPGSLTGSTVAVSPPATTVYTVTGTSVEGCTNTATFSLTVNSIPTLTAAAAASTICAGNTTTLGATGALTYTWNPGAATGFTVMVSPSATTIYTVTGENALGCTGATTVSVDVIPNINVTAVSSSTAICAGSSATLTGGGATSYTWDPGSTTGSTTVVTPSTTTIYTVTGSNGICTNTSTISVTVNPTPTITASSNPTIICVGSTATLTASGASTYTWNPGTITGTTVTVSPATTTTYTVDAVDIMGCIATQTVDVTVGSPTVSATASSNTICSGQSTTLTASGAALYTWNPGALTGAVAVVSPTATTTYTVDGDNGFGCLGSNTITVTVNTTPTLSISATSTTLCSVGAITLTATGGTTYTWSPISANTASVIDNPTVTTTYTVNSDNGTGCIGTETITIHVGTNPTLTLSASAGTVCLGNTATLNASGAASYTWNPGALTGSTAVVSPVANTTYTVIGDNGIGCTSSETITISVGASLSVTASTSSNTLCSGSSATLTGSGATSYTWNPGAIAGSTTVVSPTVSTTYTVDADNGTGCVANSTVTINVNALPTLTISATSTTLCSLGTVTMTSSGASTYTWMPIAAVTATVADSPTVTTTYTVTGTDIIGCSNSETITINVGTVPIVNASSTSTSICAGASATLTGSGATSYTWNPGAITGTMTVVSPTSTTTYTVDGDNGTGCVASNTITINVNSIPSLSITASSTAICSAGSVTLTASGGTTYTWSPVAATTASVVDSPTTTTTYTVSSDNSGCTGTQTILVNVGASPSMTITAFPTGTLCAGTTATLTASGAVSYTWNPTSATTSTITDAPAVTTTYTITGDNGFGCIGTNTFVLDVTPGTPITAVANPTTACINSTVSLSASGANTYTWMPINLSGATVTTTVTAGTTYTVLGDNGTCVGSSTVFVDVTPGPANVTSSVSGDITCITSTVDLFGNTTSSPVTYLWTGPGSYTSAIQNPIGITQGGTYTLAVVDMLTGCTTTSTVVVTTNTTIPGFSVTASGSLGCVTTVTLNAASTTTNVLSYNWSGPSTFTSSVQSPTTNIAGDYTVTVADAITGCNVTSTVTVGTGTVLVSFTATTSGSLTCAGDVTLTATPSSTNPVMYAWNGPASFTSTVQSPTTTIAGDYTISVTDVASGCSSTSTLTVGTNTVGPNLTATTSGSLGCAASVTLTASTTSTNTLTYAWSGPASFTSTVQSPTATIAGDYTVSAIDGLTGCSSTSTVTVVTNTAIPVVAIAGPLPVLGCNTTVTLSITGMPTYSYSWSGPLSFTSTVQSPTTSVAGDYTVTVTDLTNGCQNIITIPLTTSTLVPVISATVIPATCTGTITNNDGTIVISGYGSTESYDISQATTYTGTATFMTANAIPFGGIITNTLANPATAIPYTIRVFSTNGCFTDVTVTLTPTNCTLTPLPTVLGMTKAVSTPTFVNNNAYNVTYTIVATNASTLNLTNFSIIDDLNITFPLPTTYSVITAPVITSLNSSLTINTGYDGSTQNDMLVPLSSTLTAGKKDTIVFTVQINPNGFFGPFSNSAIGFGFDGTLTISDISNTGFAWDPDNDGDPTNNDTATVVSLNPNMQIGVAKSGTVSEILADKTLDVTYVISIKNLGNDTLNSVQVTDLLMIPSPAQYTIKSGPTTSGNLVANNNYNGQSDIDLLNSASKLAPGAMETITFILNITPNELRSITNIAIGTGVGTAGTVRDSSNTGTNADPNGNGNATEPGENTPTVLELPDVNLFIPQVFTPDGDGKNDFFVIKGIEGRTVKVTVFNRWGSKVYENDAYDNTWSGNSNVSGLIIGNSKLPQGTYYYIVEFEDGADEPVNGYVVLQY